MEKQQNYFLTQIALILPNRTQLSDENLKLISKIEDICNFQEQLFTQTNRYFLSFQSFIKDLLEFFERENVSNQIISAPPIYEFIFQNELLQQYILKIDKIQIIIQGQLQNQRENALNIQTIFFNIKNEIHQQNQQLIVLQNHKPIVQNQSNSQIELENKNSKDPKRDFLSIQLDNLRIELQQKYQTKEEFIEQIQSEKNQHQKFLNEIKLIEDEIEIEIRKYNDINLLNEENQVNNLHKEEFKPKEILKISQKLQVFYSPECSQYINEFKQKQNNLNYDYLEFQQEQEGIIFQSINFDPNIKEINEYQDNCLIVVTKEFCDALLKFEQKFATSKRLVGIFLFHKQELQYEEKEQYRNLTKIICGTDKFQHHENNNNVQLFRELNEKNQIDIDYFEGLITDNTQKPEQTSSNKEVLTKNNNDYEYKIKTLESKKKLKEIQLEKQLDFVQQQTEELEQFCESFDILKDLIYQQQQEIEIFNQKNSQIMIETENQIMSPQNIKNLELIQQQEQQIDILEKQIQNYNQEEYGVIIDCFEKLEEIVEFELQKSNKIKDVSQCLLQNLKSIQIYLNTKEYKKETQIQFINLLNICYQPFK